MLEGHLLTSRQLSRLSRESITHLEGLKVLVGLRGGAHNLGYPGFDVLFEM